MYPTKITIGSPKIPKNEAQTISVTFLNWTEFVSIRFIHEVVITIEPTHALIELVLANVGYGPSETTTGVRQDNNPNQMMERFLFKLRSMYAYFGQPINVTFYSLIYSYVNGIRSLADVPSIHTLDKLYKEYSEKQENEFGTLYVPTKEELEILVKDLKEEKKKDTHAR